jgi:hypothetical protein
MGQAEATIVYPGTGGANDPATATSMPPAAREHVPNPIDRCFTS